MTQTTTSPQALTTIDLCLEPSGDMCDRSPRWSVSAYVSETNQPYALPVPYPGTDPARDIGDHETATAYAERCIAALVATGVTVRHRGVREARAVYGPMPGRPDGPQYFRGYADWHTTHPHS